MKMVVLSIFCLMVVARGIVLGLSAEDAQARAQEKAKTAMATQKTEPFQLVVNMRDGSRLIGVLTVELLSVKTPYARIDLPLKRITIIEFVDEHNNVKITCANEDVVQGTLDMSSIDLKTSFNKVTLQVKDIVRIETHGGGAGPGLVGLMRQGLILYYPFDKDEGATVTDQSGHECNGTLDGARWSNNGAVGGCLSFQGEGGYVSFAAKDFPFNRKPRTMSAWVYQNTIKPRHYVVGYGACNQNAEWRMSLNEFTPGQFSVETYACGWHSSASLAAKKWYHLAVVYDGAGAPKFYVNGESRPVAGTWGSPSVATREGEGRIGERGNCERGHTFDGKVDEVMIWERMLSGAEIRSLYGRRIGRLNDTE